MTSRNGCHNDLSRCNVLVDVDTGFSAIHLRNATLMTEVSCCSRALNTDNGNMIGNIREGRCGGCVGKWVWDGCYGAKSTSKRNDKILETLFS